MSKENVLSAKTFNFALRTIKLCQNLNENQKEFVLSKQLLRSGTSIGANVREANGAQSEKDFLSKISIAYKESLETEYWLLLLRESGLVQPRLANSMLQDCIELKRIISKIKITLKNKSNLQIS